jgi:hypothetical protein
MENFEIDANGLWKWAAENAMLINSARSKAVCFTRARVTEPLNYSLWDIAIREASSCEYLGIILRSDQSLADQVKYTVNKAWNALDFTMRILKKGSGNTIRLAYTSPVRPILEYGAACWDPYRKGQINALEHVKDMAKFAHHTCRNDSHWETLTQRRKIARICALFKAYTGERAWKLTMLSEQGRS